jgi:hypothetical protein
MRSSRPTSVDAARSTGLGRLQTQLYVVLPQAVRPQGLDKANSRIAGTQIVVDEFTGPGNLPDGLSSHARYTQAFSIFIRGFSMEPIEP